MKTAPKQADGHPTDRVLHALATVAALLDRTINEVKSVDLEFQECLSRAVHETEAALQSQAAEHLKKAKTEWEAERARLVAALEHSARMGAEWETERGRLNSEIEQLRNSLTELQTQKEMEMTAGRASIDDALSKEIKRIEDLIRNISSVIADPGADLTIIIRKNVERAELESYLKGIRYAFTER